MIIGNSALISEVKKRLAKKRELRMRKIQTVIVDQIPLETIKYHRQSLLLSYSDFKNNQKYIQNFIKEKSYKSIFSKRKSLIIRRVNSNSLLNNKKNNKSNISIILKSKKNIKSNPDNNAKKNSFNTPKKTPFQIHRIKTQLFRDYINISQKKNLSINMKNESNIKSFSINKYNEKKRVFGKKYNIKKRLFNKDNFNNYKNIINNDDLKIKNNKNNNYTKIKINSHTNELISKEKKHLKINKSLKVLNPNCYFNKLNLDKISKKVSINKF